MAETLIGDIIPIVNETILDEYKDVLSRRKFGFLADEIAELVALLQERAVFLEGGQISWDMPDSDDAMFYAVVMEARENEEAYLVTGNIKHFPVKPFVVTPQEMLQIIDDSHRKSRPV